MTFLIGAVSFVALIVLVVGVHEFGHFGVAKLSGIRVDEFAIGFGPRIWQRRRGETIYSVRALPLGGFVKMPGMSTLEDDDGGERGFMAASTPRKVAVLVAGVMMNFLFAGIVIGITRIPSSGSTVVSDTPAAQAGLHTGDVIVSAGGRPLDTSSVTAQSDVLHDVTLASNGSPIQIVYRSPDGSTHTASMAPQLVLSDQNADQPLRTASGSMYLGPVTIDTIDGQPIAKVGLTQLQQPGQHQVVGHAQADASVQVSGSLSGVILDQGVGQIGKATVAWRIGYGAPIPQQNPVSAIFGGIKDVPGDIKDNVSNIWQILTTPGSGGVSNFSGPVGIAHATSDAANTGFMYWLGLVGLVSLSLGIVNILPVPPFDGGRLAIVLAEAVARRRLEARLEMGFIAAGAVAIATLFVFITINDIKGF
jgi:regulator of sigma E protease